MTFGKKIKKLRTQKGLTQKELADKVFVTFQTVSKWENDDNEPDFATLKLLAKEFDCSVDYLLNEEDEGDKQEERTVVAPVTPVEQVTKTVIIHQKEMHVCERCKKDIPEDDLVMEDVPHRSGRTTTYTKAYYHKACLEQVIKERNGKAAADAREHARKAKIKSIGWGSAIGIVTLVIFMIALLSKGELHPAASVAISIGLGYVGFATGYCILSGSYIEDAFLTVASWSIHLPGVIFTLDLEGLIFLIAVKILFAVIGFLFGIFVLLLAVVIAAFLSTFSFPFVLIHNTRCNYVNAI